MKKISFLLAFFLAFMLLTSIPTISASQTEIFVDSAEKQIEQGKTVAYQITILNLAKEEKKFSLSVSEETFANFRIVPIEQKIKADASGIFKVYVEAKQTIGTKRFNIEIRRGGQLLKEIALKAVIVEEKKGISEQMSESASDIASSFGDITKVEWEEPLMFLGFSLFVLLLALSLFSIFSSSKRTVSFDHEYADYSGLRGVAEHELRNEKKDASEEIMTRAIEQIFKEKKESSKALASAVLAKIIQKLHDRDAEEVVNNVLEKVNGKNRKENSKMMEELIEKAIKRLEENGIDEGLKEVDEKLEGDEKNIGRAIELLTNIRNRL